MKKILLSTLFAFIGLIAFAQEEFTEEVPPFDKITISPKINLVLIKGDTESVKVAYKNIHAGRINVTVNGGRLRVFLDEARFVDRRERKYYDDGYDKVSIYHNAEVTAYVTYHHLHEVEMRGEEILTCDSEINTEKFKLKIFGNAEVNIASVKAYKFKTSIYGTNKIKIVGGKTTHQVYRLFGENKIDTRGMENVTASARIYGEGKLMLTAKEELKINSFGEPDIEVNGSAHIHRGIIMGRTHIDTRD
jgi:hypothetical protein